MAKLQPVNSDELRMAAGSADDAASELHELIHRMEKTVPAAGPDYREAASTFARLAQQCSRLTVLCLAYEDHAAQKKEVEALRAKLNQ
jgi:uncharacterized protein YukE